jgi:hypothetical protein
MTSTFQRERLDSLLGRLTDDEPLPLYHDHEEPLLDRWANDQSRPRDLNQKNDWLSSTRWLWSERWLSSKRWLWSELSSRLPSIGKPSRALIILITSCTGVAATLAWQSYRTPSADPPQLQAMSLDLVAVRQSMDRLAAQHQQMAGDLAAVRQSVDRLAAQHQQMADDIANLQAAQQAILRKVSTAPPPPPRQPRNPQN